MDEGDPRAIQRALDTFLSGEEPFAVVRADVHDVLRLLPAGSFDAVLADPPYGTGEWKRTKAGAGGDCRAVHHQAEWDVWDPSWIVPALRVARGPVASMTPMTPMTRLEELLALGREAGVSTRLHTWVKPDPRPRFSGQPAYGFEPCVIYRSNLLDGGEADYTIASSPRMNRDTEAEGHPHQKPLVLCRRLVRQTTPDGGSVLSLFAGSGSDAEAAILEGRRVLAVEGRAEWCAKINDRAHRSLFRQRKEPALLLRTQETLPLAEMGVK